MKTLFVAIVALCSQSAVAFAPTTVSSQTSTTALPASSNDGVDGKNLALSGIAAALIATAVASPTAAVAYDSYSNTNVDFGSSSELIAARSGGRAGGRSMGGRSSMGARSMPRSRTVVAPSSTTYIRPPSTTVIMGSPFGYSPFSPFGGFGE